MGERRRGYRNSDYRTDGEATRGPAVDFGTILRVLSGPPTSTQRCTVEVEANEFDSTQTSQVTLAGKKLDVNLVLRPMQESVSAPPPHLRPTIGR